MNFYFKKLESPNCIESGNLCKKPAILHFSILLQLLLQAPKTQIEFQPKNKPGGQFDLLAKKLIAILALKKAEVKFSDFLLQTNSSKLAEMRYRDPTPFTSAVWINKYKQSSLTNFFAQKVCQAV